MTLILSEARYLSFSEVTVIKVNGQYARQIRQKCRIYQEQRRVLSNSAGFSGEDWPKRVRDNMDRAIAKVLAGWKTVSIVFAAKFMDNDSVGGSQLHNIHKIMSGTYGVDTGILATNKYIALYFSGGPKGAAALELCSRKNQVKSQSSERRLCFLLTEACRAWQRSGLPSTILAVDEALEPTRT